MAAPNEPCCNRQEGVAIDRLQGSVPPEALDADPRAARAETLQLRRGIVAYHYFEGTKVPQGWSVPLQRVIRVTRQIGSRIRCLTEAEIVASVAGASADRAPHDGDGAYCTLHDDLVSAHPAVVASHGIDPEIARYRAVIRLLKAPEHFRKFARTGGVTRSIPPDQPLPRGEMVFIGEDTGEIALLRIERYENGRWRVVGQGE